MSTANERSPDTRPGFLGRAIAAARDDAARDAGLVFLIALVVRVPYTATTLWAWDSVLYARALELGFHLSGDPFDQRPHPPGYPVYLFIASVLRRVTADSNAALVGVSIVAGALACGTAVLLARRLGGRRAGLVAGTAAIANPVLWHASEVAYPYALLALLVGAMTLALIEVRTPRGMVLASAGFGLAIGARQDVALLVGPLWIASLLSARFDARTQLGASAAALATTLLWLVPTAEASGGLDRYVALVLMQLVGSAGLDLPGGAAVGRNLELTASGLWWQLLWLWPVAFAGMVMLTRERRTRADAIRLASVIVPALGLYVALHIGEHAYTLSLAVLLDALVGIGAVALMRAFPARLAALAPISVSAAAVLLALTFAAGSERFSASAIRRHDEILRAQIVYVRQHFPVAQTVLLAQPNYWHARYYLQEYRVVYLPDGKRARLHRRLSAVRYALFLDDQWLRFARARLTHVALAHDIELYYIRTAGQAMTLVGGDDHIDVVNDDVDS